MVPCRSRRAITSTAAASWTRREGHGRPVATGSPWPIRSCTCWISVPGRCWRWDVGSFRSSAMISRRRCEESATRGICCLSKCLDRGDYDPIWEFLVDKYVQRPNGKSYWSWMILTHAHIIWPSETLSALHFVMWWPEFFALVNKIWQWTIPKYHLVI